MTKDSNSAKEKSQKESLEKIQNEKVEFAIKIKQVMQENETFKTKLVVIEKEKTEL